MNFWKKVKVPSITPELLAYLRGEIGCSDELQPVMDLLLDAYKDGKAGVNESEYPRYEDLEYIVIRDENGNILDESKGIKKDTICRFLMLERLAWEQGRMDAEMGVAV